MGGFSESQWLKNDLYWYIAACSQSSGWARHCLPHTRLQAGHWTLQAGAVQGTMQYVQEILSNILTV